MTYNYEKHYDHYVNIYGKGRDGLDAVLYEANMVNGTPNHMIGGTEEKESILFALHVLEEELRHKFNAFGSGRVF